MSVATALSTPAVRIEQLSHTYPPGKRRRRHGGGNGQVTTPRPALDNVSFEIEPGEIFGILGPNGGGKTTLFRILATMMQPDRGRLTVFGDDVLAQPDRVRRHLGVVFQYPSIDGKLTAAENLRHQGNLYGLRGSDLERRITDWLERVNLADRRDDFVEHFSGGMRRRVELAKAMLHEPRLLLLDEPDTGLDPGARADLWRQLEMLRAERGTTVVLTTHLMEQADRCDRLAILAAGRLVALDTPANLKAMIGGDVVTLQTDEDTDSLCQAIANRFAPWPDGGEPRIVDGTIRFQRPDGPQFIPTLTAAFGNRIRSVTVGQPTLEDVFLHLTGHRLYGERD